MILLCLDSESVDSSEENLLKGLLTSKRVSVFTLLLLLTAVACFSGTITAPQAAWAASRVSQHGLALPPGRLGQRASAATGGGQLRWRYQTGGFVVSSPAVVNGVVYVGSYNGYVIALTA